MFKKIYAPLSIQWEVFPECNYKCIHCYNYWRRSNESVGEYWSLYNGNKVVDEIIKSKVNSVTITGGEPFLVFDKIISFIDRLLDNGIRVVINTNASLINDKIAEYLHKNSIGILVSLPCAIPEINDEITNYSGSFDATTQGIKIALKHGVSLATNMVVSTINQNHVIQTAEFINNGLGLKKFNATKASRPINAGNRFDQYGIGYLGLQKMICDLVYIKNELGMAVDTLTAYPNCSFLTEEAFQLLGAKRMCSAGKTAAVIGYDGNVRACTRDVESYGKLEQSSLIECWEKMNEWRDNSLLPDSCKGCKSITRCLGGCRVEALVENLSKNADDPCMDTNNLPIKFSSKVSAIELSDTFKFMFQERIQFSREEFGIRATINAKSQFITEELFEFINLFNRDSFFTKSDIMNYFNIDIKCANELLNRLNNYGFLLVEES